MYACRQFLGLQSVSAVRRHFSAAIRRRELLAGWPPDARDTNRPRLCISTRPECRGLRLAPCCGATLVAWCIIGASGGCAAGVGMIGGVGKACEGASGKSRGVSGWREVETVPR